MTPALGLERKSTPPARVLNALPTGQLCVGGVADICVFDPNSAWVVEPKALRSQGKHPPFSGYELPGRVRCTLVGGQIAYQSAD